jgi:putative membrane protein
MQVKLTSNDNGSYWVIGILSVVIPVAVALLLFLPFKLSIDKQIIGLLPHLNGVINSITAVVLIMGLVFIMQQNIQLHKTAMMVAFILGSLFLVSYIIYHASAESTVYGDLNGDGILSPYEKEQLGSLRVIYLSILLTHIFLAITVVPFVLTALFHAYKNNVEKHRKAVKWAFPIWLYVSISGVIVYLMISPYYVF